MCRLSCLLTVDRRSVISCCSYALAASGGGFISTLNFQLILTFIANPFVISISLLCCSLCRYFIRHAIYETRSPSSSALDTNLLASPMQLSGKLQAKLFRRLELAIGQEVQLLLHLYLYIWLVVILRSLWLSLPTC